MIRLEPLRGHERCCSRCGRLTPAIHDLEERRIRDLPLFEHGVELRVLRVWVECPTCGPKLERLAWLAAYARVTRRPAARTGAIDLDGLQVIALDEFAIHKRHRYATVIVEPTRKRVLWIGRGRGRQDVRPFFNLLGVERCALGTAGTTRRWAVPSRP